MQKRFDFFIVFLSAIILTFLFHRQDFGMNLLIFEILLFAWFYFTRQFTFRGTNQVTIGIGLLVSAVFTVVTYSLFVYIMNLLSLFLFIGILIYPNVRSLINSTRLSLINLPGSQIQFMGKLKNANVGRYRFGTFFRTFRIFFLPVVVILFFIVIYRIANPVFDNVIINISRSFEKFFSYIFQDFDALIILTFLAGICISSYIFLRTTNDQIIKNDTEAGIDLKRTRKIKPGSFRINALKYEYRSGIFLLVLLNAVLLVLNIIDINWVWFNFEWEGQYLKQFVHEGTWLLIFSILVSISLVVYYFRANMNFYPGNRLLKYLCYIWLAQNMILTVSVAIRNLYYIDYFSLAYKRIGVILFLLLTLYGLYSVLMKVKYRKSAFYLFKTNSYILYIVLLMASLVNWDSVIAEYNFTHAHRSFLHLNYMATLPDKTLPYLDQPLPVLLETDKLQKQKFQFRQKYMTPDRYHEVIQARKEAFSKKWKSKSILSWNYPEYSAYRKLKS